MECNHRCTRTMKEMDIYCSNCNKKLDKELSEWGHGWHQGYKDGIKKVYEKEKILVPSVAEISYAINKTLKASCTCNNGQGIVCVGCFYRKDLVIAIYQLLLKGEK